MNRTPQKGDTVRLLTKPSGYTTSSYPLTVGKEYLVVDLMGSCVVTTCDDPDWFPLPSYWRGWVEVVNYDSPAGK
jgi:hypothetical protein